jgi:hypothetical protein
MSVDDDDYGLFDVHVVVVVSLLDEFVTMAVLKETERTMMNIT